MDHAAAIAELREAMERLEPEPEHTHHVAFLALRIFDDLSELHGLGLDERVLLEGAARLHDIGWAATTGNVGRGHHKHSARLIRCQPWKFLRGEEVELMALVARYHRKALPSSEHGDFHRLSQHRKRTVRHLAAILRLADAFDRSHMQYVRNVHTRVDVTRMEFVLESGPIPAREIAGAEKKGNLAREVFGCDLQFRHQAAEPPGSAR